MRTCVESDTIRRSFPFPTTNATPMRLDVLLVFLLLQIRTKGNIKELMLYRIHDRQRIRLEILEDGLVHDKHSAALHAGPDGARAHAAEPASQAFGLVDDFEAGDDGGRVDCGGRVHLQRG